MINILACVGLTFILKYGSILNYPRRVLCKVVLFHELFRCSLCLGLWSGVIVGLINYYISRAISTDVLLLPLISAGVCWFADSLITILQYIELKLEKDNNS